MTEAQDPNAPVPPPMSEPIANGEPPVTPAVPDPSGSGPVAWTPPAPAPKRSNVRLFVILGVMVVFLAFVFYETRNNQSANDLAVGACFDEPSASTDISTVTRHDCTEAHDAEVIAVAEYGDSSGYPTDAAIHAFVNETCVPVFNTYVGEDYQTNPDLSINYFYPDSDGWDSGDRTVTCYVVRDDATPMTQSIKGSAGGAPAS